mgnify:CR=1 FL=1
MVAVGVVVGLAALACVYMGPSTEEEEAEDDARVRECEQMAAELNTGALQRRRAKNTTTKSVKDTKAGKELHVR